MTTFVTVLAAAAVAFPLVVLALRGTRADLIRGRDGRPAPLPRRLGLADPRDTDATRAAHDVEAAAARGAEPVGAPAARVRRYVTGPGTASGPGTTSGAGAPGRSLHLTGSSSGTKPNLA
ncbi:hypothetical protein [Cellulomonas alba]|uniref:Uncharacterized protein n=1 Tax=Cellulomonas alba TaxID=3053467 RepID=A0ABT7SD52_9CELL|nr:hypothetical protein [Cellulomonas alba]MDM7854127.1 hypothetical protein [Cellulomonas alba]